MCITDAFLQVWGNHILKVPGCYLWDYIPSPCSCFALVCASVSNCCKALSMSDGRTQQQRCRASAMEEGECIFIWLPVNDCMPATWMKLSSETAAPFSIKKGNQLITDRQYSASHWQTIKCISTDMNVVLLRFASIGGEKAQTEWLFLV